MAAPCAILRQPTRRPMTRREKLYHTLAPVGLELTAHTVVLVCCLAAQNTARVVLQAFPLHLPTVTSGGE